MPFNSGILLFSFKLKMRVLIHFSGFIPLYHTPSYQHGPLSDHTLHTQIPLGTVTCHPLSLLPAISDEEDLILSYFNQTNFQQMPILKFLQKHQICKQ